MFLISILRFDFLSLLLLYIVFRVANPPGMGGRLPKFNSISRLPPDVAREMIISRNAPNLVVYNNDILKYRNGGLKLMGIVNKTRQKPIAWIKCDAIDLEAVCRQIMDNSQKSHENVKEGLQRLQTGRFPESPKTQKSLPEFHQQELATLVATRHWVYFKALTRCSCTQKFKYRVQIIFLNCRFPKGRKTPA